MQNHEGLFSILSRMTKKPKNLFSKVLICTTLSPYVGLQLM